MSNRGRQARPSEAAMAAVETDEQQSTALPTVDPATNEGQSPNEDEKPVEAPVQYETTIAPPAGSEAVLSILTEAEWPTSAGGPGRTAQASPYLAAVLQAAQTGKVFELPLTVQGANAEEQDKALTREVNALRRAGRQIKPEVTVMTLVGDIERKTGAVTVRFRTRAPIRRTPQSATQPTAPEATQAGASAPATAAS